MSHGFSRALLLEQKPHTGLHSVSVHRALLLKPSHWLMGVQAPAEHTQEADTSAEAAMQRIAKGLPTGSGIIALAVANSQAHAAGCHIRIEPRQSSNGGVGTTVSLWLPAR
jgi:hypothetical protein